jgi:ferredoxin
MPVITFIPANCSIEVAVGTSLLDAAALAGATIAAPCGGEGVCGECRVCVANGTVERLERGGLSAEELAEGWALACSSRVLADATISLVSQLPADTAQIVTNVRQTGVADTGTRGRGDAEKTQAPRQCSDPPAIKRALHVPPPELGQGLRAAGSGTVLRGRAGASDR